MVSRIVMGLFLSDTYHSLRNGEDVGSGTVYQYENTTPMMVAEKPVDYGTDKEKQDLIYMCSELERISFLKAESKFNKRQHTD